MAVDIKQHFNQIAVEAAAISSALVAFGNELTAVVQAQLGSSQPLDIDRLLPASYGEFRVPNVFLPHFSSTRPSVSVTPGPVPATPTFQFSPLNPVTVPDFNDAPPAIAIPLAPDATLPPVPAAPSLSEPDIPTAPALNLPAAPELTGVTLPQPPSIALPQFTSTAPDDDLLVPTNNFSFAEQAYLSTLIDPLKAKLLADLLNGGYGIETADEEQLFERLRERETEAAQASIDEVYRLGAARGFPLPPGEVFVAVQRAEQALQDRLSTASREIALERSRLFVENRQFTIGQVREVEAMLINLHNSVQERALNSARFTFQASIEIYNAVVARFNARLAKYQAGAAIFEAQIRAALSQVEIYRVTMDGKRIELQAQGQLIDNFKARVEAAKTVIDIFRVQMDAANVRATIERTRIEAFRGLIDAFQAQVQAKVAEFGMFRARVDGELAKLQIFETQARAYESQVNGARVKSDVQLGNLRAETEQAQAKLGAFQASLEGYRANLAALIDSGRLQVDLYQADNQQISVFNQNLRANAELDLSAINSTREQNIKLADVAIANARAKVAAAIQGFELKTEVAKYLPNIQAKTLEALLGQLNVLSVENQE